MADTASVPAATTESTKKPSRSFKVMLSGETSPHGRYNGNSPYQAANKAFSEIVRARVKDGLDVSEDIQFTLLESTKGSSKKSYQYVGKRIQLAEPVRYKVGGGQEITKAYKNILRKVKSGSGKKDDVPAETAATPTETSA